jgi:hypothetical protein
MLLFGSFVVFSKKTEGLELGAVDKLLVGIFVGCDGEEGRILSSLIPDHPIYSCVVSQSHLIMIN